MLRPAVDVVAPTPAHVEELAANLRQQDRDELDAGGHRDHQRTIADSVAMSDWSLTALVEGRVACIFGVAPHGSLLDPRGIPWMLGTELVTQNRRALARLAPVYIRVMLQAYPRLVNVVHARNTVAVRWLKRSGFVLGPAFARNGETFHPFEMRHV
jgi:hypothetical protein